MVNVKLLIIKLFQLRGQDPLGLSDGEGVVGVTTTHKNITEKKKSKKKIKKIKNKNKKIKPNTSNKNTTNKKDTTNP